MIWSRAMDSAAPNLITRYKAGALLFILYTRSRAFDAARIDNEPRLDPFGEGKGYVEATAGITKTNQRGKRFREEQPVVAPLWGISDTPEWAPAWLARRESLALRAGEEAPLLPTLGPDDQFVLDTPM